MEKANKEKMKGENTPLAHSKTLKIVLEILKEEIVRHQDFYSSHVLNFKTAKLVR